MYAYICVYEWIAYGRKLYVGRVSFQCVCMEDNEIDKPWSSLKHCVYQESDLNRRVWLAQGGVSRSRTKSDLGLASASHGEW